MSQVWLVILYAQVLAPTVYMLSSLRKERELAPLWHQLPLPGWALLSAKYAAAIVDFLTGAIASAGMFLAVYNQPLAGQEPIISFDRVTKHYQAKTAIRDISLTSQADGRIAEAVKGSGAVQRKEDGAAKLPGHRLFARAICMPTFFPKRRWPWPISSGWSRTYIDLDKQAVVISAHEVEEIEPMLDGAILVRDGRLLGQQAVDSIREEHGLDWWNG